MKVAVSASLAGLSLRHAARAVGWSDHNELARVLRRYGLQEAHKLRQQELERGERELLLMRILQGSRALREHARPDPYTHLEQVLARRRTP